MRRTPATLAVATVVLIAAVGTLTALGAPASALVGRGSAGAPLTISFKDAKGTTTTTVTIAADGTYKADFGISSFDDYTATIKKSDGSTLAAIPITVTQAAEPCITPTAGTGADWGVTHSPFPVDPRFPSYVTICGRVALATTGNSSTPAGSPPSLGTPDSVSRDNPGNVTQGNSDDGSGFPWLAIVGLVVVIGVVVAGLLLWRRAHNDDVGSPDPDPDPDADDTPSPDDTPPPS